MMAEKFEKSEPYLGVRDSSMKTHDLLNHSSAVCVTVVDFHHSRSEKLVQIF